MAGAAFAKRSTFFPSFPGIWPLRVYLCLDVSGELFGIRTQTKDGWLQAQTGGGDGDGGLWSKFSSDIVIVFSVQ